MRNREEAKEQEGIVIKITPIGKPRMTRSDAWRKRVCVCKYWEFKNILVRRAREESFSITDGLRYIFYFPMPHSWSKKKKLEHFKKPHRQKPDLDNCLKAVWDSLLVDDSKISSISGAYKYWSSEGCIWIN